MPESKWREVFEYVVSWTLVVAAAVGLYIIIRWLAT